ncbi:MAG: hypothetical protein J6Y32_03880 [Bacteroidales bacterium]|nr:hypothetical protein [Bacteroidales bacterium]
MKLTFKLLTGLLLLITTTVQAQHLMNTTTYIKSEAAGLIINQLTQHKCMPLSHLGKQTDEWYNEQIRSKLLTTKRQECAKTMCRSLARVRGNEISIFYHFLSPMPTLQDDKDTCVYIGGFSYQMALNSLRLDEKQRAQKVAENVIVPILQNAAPHLKKLNYPYSMIGAAYDVRDFSKSNPYDKSTACVICVFKTSDIMSFYELAITQEEFLKSSKVYVQDEGEIKRISF